MDDVSSSNILPFKKRRRALSNRAALQFLREAAGDDGVVKIAGYVDLAALLGWTKDHAYKACQRWTKAKRVEVEIDDSGGLLAIRALPDRARLVRGQGSGLSTDKRRRGGRGGSGYGSAADSPRMSSHDVLVLLAALWLASVSGCLSIAGMVVLFPGSLIIALALGGALETAKIVTAGWLGRCWHEFSSGVRTALIVMTAGVAVINAVGVYSQLVHLHLSARGEMQAGLEIRDAEAAARIEVAQAKLADLDRRLALIDGTVEAASKHGAAKTSAALIQQQQRQRAALAEERQQAARSLADLKSARAEGAARGRAAETEAAPIMYVTEMLGIRRGGEEVIRWLITLIVCTTDPFALALAAAISSRRRRAA